MITHNIQIKDYLEVNGQRIFVWSVVVRSDGVVKVKTEHGNLIQIKNDTKIQHSS